MPRRSFKRYASKRNFRRSSFMSKRKAARKGVINYMRKRTASSVRKVLSKSTELKKATYTAGAGIILDQAISATADARRIIPSVNPGVEPDRRIGQSICAKKLVVRGILQYNPMYNDTNDTNALIAAPVIPRLMLLKLKRRNDYQDVVGTDFDELLELGSYGGQYTGDINRHFLPVNRDIFTVKKDIRWKRNLLPYRLQISGTGPANTLISNTSTFVNFTLTMKFGKNGKILNYRDSSASLPMDFPYFFVVGYANPNGNTGMTNRLIMEYSSILYYTDK